MSNLRILFVDDEANILAGLKRMLHPLRQEWEMSFCDSGEKALQLLQQESFDVLVTDIRMPKVDGSRVLFESFLYHPETMRCVLSGYAERGQTLKVTGTAHQFISKPCTQESIVRMVRMAEQLKQRLPNIEIRQAVSRLSAVPCRPSVLRLLHEELGLEQPSPDRVANLIASDVGMSAKLIQLVASSFFGRSTQVYSPGEAITLLGVDLVANLLLEIGIFTPFLGEDSMLDIDELCIGSMEDAVRARSSVERSGGSARSANVAYLSQYMKHIGSIVLAHQLPEVFRRMQTRCREGGIPVEDAEREAFGATAAAVGGYLLAIWGFPQEVVDAVGNANSPILPAVANSTQSSNQKVAL